MRKLVKRYKFNGEDKYSVGLIAQQVIAAFEAEGLDPFKYRLLTMKVNTTELITHNYCALLLEVLTNDAINFIPIDSNDGNPTDGMVWTAPNGRQWIYDETVPGWKSLAGYWEQ